MTFPQEIPVWEKGYITFDFRHQHGDKIRYVKKETITRDRIPNDRNLKHFQLPGKAEKQRQSSSREKIQSFLVP